MRFDPEVAARLGQLGSRVVGLQPCLVGAVGDGNAAIFLRQAIHIQGIEGVAAWWSRGPREWEEETGLTRTRQRRASRILEERRLIETQVRPGRPTLYRVALRRVVEAAATWRVSTSDTPGRTTPTHQVGRPSHTRSDDPIRPTTRSTADLLPHLNKRIDTDADSDESASRSSQTHLWSQGEEAKRLRPAAVDEGLFESFWKVVQPKQGKSGARKVWLAGLLNRETLRMEVLEARPAELAHSEVPEVSVLIARRLEWQAIRERDWGPSGPPLAIWPQGWLNKERWTRENLDALEARRQQAARRASGRRSDVSQHTPLRLREDDPEVAEQLRRIREVKEARRREERGT